MQVLSNRYYFKFIFVLLVLALLFCADVLIGTVSISVTDLLKNLFSNSETTVHTILWQFRVPKTLTCVLAGAGLATSGMLMQTLFRNPLAGPDVLGLSSGSSVAIGLLFFLGKEIHFSMNEWSVALAASAGGMLILLLMLFVARKVRDNASLLIIGLMVAAVTSAVMNLIQFLSRAEDLQSYVIWTMGSVGNTGWRDLSVLAVVIFLGMGICIFLLKSLNGWLLGENYARSLGINVNRSRFWIVIATGLMTGGITAFCGPIAFVGLAVPHMARLMFPAFNHKILFPAVLCGGAVLLLFCDILGQLSGATQVLPLNALTSLIGAPVVIWQVMKFKRVSI